MHRLTSASSSHRVVPHTPRPIPLALVIATVTLCVGLAPGTLRAQQQPAAAADGPAGFLHVTAVTVKPAGVIDFEEYAKKAVAAVAKVSGRQVLTYQPMYGNPSVYYFVVSLTTGKDLDGLATVPQAVMKVYGEVEGARLLKTGRAVIESITVERQNTVRRISTNLRTGAKPSRYYQVMRTVFRPEMADEYLNILEKIKKAEEAQPNAVTATRRVLGEGGPPNTVIVVRGFDSFEERSAWAGQREIIRKVYGNDEDRLMNQTIQRALLTRESNVLVYRADLSSQAAPAATGQH